MKKYLLFLVVGMLFFCGIENIASSMNHSESQPEKLVQQPKFILDVKGGIGLSFILTNVGNQTFKGNISGNVTINDCLVLFGKTKTIASSNYEIGVGKSITFTHFVIGLGSAIVNSDFHIENVALIESVSNCFIFLIFALFH